MTAVDQAENSTPKKVKPLPDWVAPFLVDLRNTANVRAACKAAGIDRKTAYDLRKRSKLFEKQWDEAMEDACDVLEAAARKRAMTSSDLLLIFLLKAHRPEKYRETTRQEVTGAGGGPVDVRVTAADVMAARKRAADWERETFGASGEDAGQ